MKKSVLLYLFFLIIITAGISFFLLNRGNKEIKDNEKISQIVFESNIEDFINLENFSKKSFLEENILKSAMKFAKRNGYTNEVLGDNEMEYINQGELHSIINETMGINVEAPIQIDDFYIVYDSESEYYYFLPNESETYNISKINHVYKNSKEQYIIECTATKTNNDETIEKNFRTTISPIKDGVYTKYQIIKQEVL